MKEIWIFILMLLIVYTIFIYVKISIEKESFWKLPSSWNKY